MLTKLTAFIMGFKKHGTWLLTGRHELQLSARMMMMMMMTMTDDDDL